MKTEKGYNKAMANILYRNTCISFPAFSGARCLMMPFIQGEPESVPKEYHGYFDILRCLFFKAGDVGYLTIDESVAKVGIPHRGSRARTSRALHTEVGRLNGTYGWGDGGGWGSPTKSGYRVTLDKDVRILISSNVSHSCAVWDACEEATSQNGDIGHLSEKYPYDTAHYLDSGAVADIGILTPHESLPLRYDTKRQFIRIVSSGVHGREDYFTRNPMLSEGVQ